MGKPIREFESRPLRRTKGNAKSVAFFVAESLRLLAVGRQEATKKGIAERCILLCKDARGSEEIFNLAAYGCSQSEGWRQQKRA
ncbi:MAG: hypothetical protein IKQ75_05005 [Bacteroidales bacterium]|nr:hypothetical protein [Bacteroidales bacterium]